MPLRSNVPLLFTFYLAALFHGGAADIPPAVTNSLLPSDAVALLSFKSKADLDNKLLYDLIERFDYCQWRGVKCAQSRVVRLVLPAFGLRGVFASNTLTKLDQLRVLSLENNSLSGPVPDLSSLSNLKGLFLSYNNFSGKFPLSVLSLHRLTTLDLSFNIFSGPIPVHLTVLDRLISLKLESNRFDGAVPPLNQSLLVVFNVSRNKLAGPIPATPTLSRFGTAAFSLNPNLCGEIINTVCPSGSPFFEPPNSTASQAPLGQSAQSQSGGVVVQLPPPADKRNKRHGAILGLTISVAVIIGLALSMITFSLIIKNRNANPDINERNPKQEAISETQYENPNINNTIHILQQQETKTETEEPRIPIRRSGNLMFFTSEAESYNMQQLMGASAELLGRGSTGTTYKAELGGQFAVTVKRIDANKSSMTSSEAFEHHMDIVGGLRHPNLVPIQAYFQAKGERLIIYDYQPNGSLFNLIHGSRSSRSKPLHWTSCLKIAEDVAQGLSYIHQSSPPLIHNNIKSTNILLGPDFEACLTDYCLTVLTDCSISTSDPYSTSYKAPETRNALVSEANPKWDVYAFGVLLLELLTGKNPSEHPCLAPEDVFDWVRAMREGDGVEDDRLGMLIEVASVCSLRLPELRPTMWQVLNIIHEIKESEVIIEEESSGDS